MALRDKVYCITCGAMRPYRIESSIEEVTVREVSFSYKELKTICKKCGNKVYVPAVNDNNWYERHRAYFNKIHEEVSNHE